MNGSSKTFLGREKKSGRDEMEKDLPSAYGHTEIYAMVRDPHWFFTYWEITPQKLNQIKKEHGQDILENSKAVIRIYDVTQNSDLKNLSSCDFFDEYISFDSKNWYINVKKSGHSYVCSIGLLTKNGKFIKIADSNIVRMPSGRVSNVTDEEWMVSGDEFNKLMEMSASTMEASGTFVNLLAKRWEIIKSVSSGSMFVSSFKGVSSYGGAKQCPLELECELVLKGGTCPQANITAGGKMVRVNPDGTFSTNINLPEGTTEIPVRCSTCDRTKQKKVIVTAEKKVSANE
jgi:hypothetical protein